MRIFLFILAATIFEASGDAIIRMAIYNHVGAVRIAFFIAGAMLLFAYGCALNLSPQEFHEVVGLYIATLFVAFQVTNYVAYKTVPTLPIILGGTLIILGGLIVSFWKQH